MIGTLFAVGAGGFCGAIARYGLSAWTHRLTGDGFPWGTLAVNVVGCLLIGALMTTLQERASLPPAARALLVTGFLGALTTFSTLGYETVELLRDAAWMPALTNVLLNAALGVGAVFAGRALVLAALASRAAS